MPFGEESIVSAQVVLHAAGGEAIEGKRQISARKLRQLVPPHGTVSLLAGIFRSKGFEVGPFVGISFSVTGMVRDFEKYFRVRIRPGKDGGYEFVVNDRSVGHELSGEDLPEGLREYVQAVVFPLPPDFGPTKF